MSRFLLALLLASSAFAEPLLDGTDEHYLTLALQKLQMTPADLSFKKDNSDSEFITREALIFLHDPVALALDAGEKLTRFQAVTNLTSLVAAAVPSASSYRGSRWDGGHYTVGAAVARITAAALKLRARLPHPDRAAFDAYVVEQLDRDAAELGVSPELLRRSHDLELQDDELAQPILRAGRSFTPPDITELCHAIDVSIAELRQQHFTNEFTTVTDSPLGKIIIGGVGPNVYREDAFLIIDLGGDDVYENSAGGANGLTGLPISIVIDIAGNDRYVSRRSCSQGAGIFGVGILVDCGGDDVYEAKHFSQGAGFFGCGILADYGGHDSFKADTHCQGAATFGTGILWQRGGDTRYEARYLSQGFGGVQGTGLLLDVAGNDTYIATGGNDCGWLPGHKFTLSQGFGYGMRPFAGGGTGILCDLAGNDRYIADVYGQGASYWYAVGMLLDAGGDDAYEAYQYCQGAGIHLSSGILADLAGNDSYKAHAICQGGAHDYSVGMLIDRAGDDCYTGDSTAQGTAINNSFALLLDKSGNDSYVGTDPKQSQAAGHDGGRREYGSIAVLLDLAGKDTYSQGQTNNTTWLKPFYGCGIDTQAPPIVGALLRSARCNLVMGTSQKRPYSVAPVDPHHPTERLFRLALSDKPEAGKAWDELKQSATNALPYLLTRLNSPDVSVRAKVEELIDLLGTNSIPLLITGIDTARNDDQARLCAYFLARFETATNAIPHILPLLRREKTQGTALYTLGHLHAREAFQPAIRLLSDPREIVRMRAAQALGRIGDRRAIPRLVPLLDDPIWTVRFAARDAIAALKKEP